MKKLLSICICAVLLMSAGLTVFAAGGELAGEKRAVIGASLNEEQINQVYDVFGVSRGSVKELKVTNEEERRYLDGFVDSSLIGTNSISCVYVEVLEPGEGLQISTENLTWCTRDMFINALVTAGIDDAKIIVAAPFEVSGTAALTGIYKAYEDISGEPLDDAAKLVSTQELVITSALADEIGSYDAVSIVNELKLVLDQTENMSDDELKTEIGQLAEEYGISLKDSQIDQLVSLCRALEKMDAGELREKVEQAQQTIKKLATAKDKAVSIAQSIKNAVEKLASFIDSIISFFKK